MPRPPQIAGAEQSGRSAKQQEISSEQEIAQKGPVGRGRVQDRRINVEKGQRSHARKTGRN